MFDRFWNVFRHRRIEDEVREELETHLASIEDEERARGVNPEEAHRKARIRFGNLALYRDQTRDANLAIWIDDLRRDLKFAFRQLAGNPVFSVIVVLILALGIGANTTLFSIVHSVLITPLAYPDSDSLVRVWSAMPARGFPQADTSFPDYRAMREQNRTLVDLGAYLPARYNLSGDNRPERVRAASTTASLLRVLGVQPLIGNLYAESAEQWGAHRVVLLGEDLWRRRFGADRSIVGRTVTLDEEPWTVVGVMPATFHFPDPLSELWTPIAFSPQSNMYTRGNYFLQMVGRLRPHIAPAQALADLTAIAHAADPDISATVQTLHETVVGDVRPTLLLLSGAVMFVLLIVCVNVANLLLARATSRRKELTVRLTLGATAGRLMRQLLTESAVLATAGAGCGVLLAYTALRLLRIWGPASIPRLDEVTLNSAALGFAAGVALFTGFAFGILPAWQAAGNRTAGATLKESSRSAGTGRLPVWTRNGLVVAETALSLMLLIGAGLFIVSLTRLLQVDPGFKRENLLTLHLDLPQLRYREPARTLSFVNQAVERLNAVPGVITSGFTTALPLGEGIWGRLLTVEGQPPPRTFAEIPVVQYRQVTPGYFGALAVRLKHGRFFNAEDRQSGPPVAIINETLAGKLLPGIDPVGKLVYLGPHEALRGPSGRFPRLTIVGVTGDLRHNGVDKEPQPELFIPLAQAGSATHLSVNIAIRTAGNPRGVAASAEDVIRELDSNVPISHLRTMEELLAASLARRRFTIELMGMFALAALVLAVTGVYGVVAYSVSQRVPEIGIRVALGARPAQIVQLIISRSVGLTGAGVVLGIVLALALTRLLTNMLFGVRASDPLVYGASALVLMVSALAASYLPARRAGRIDPLAALRQE